MQCHRPIERGRNDKIPPSGSLDLAIHRSPRWMDALPWQLCHGVLVLQNRFDRPPFSVLQETRNWRTWITVLCVLLLAWCIRDQYLLSSASSLLPRPPLANSCRTSAIKNVVSGFLGPPPVTRPLGTVSILGLLHGLSLSPKARYLCMSLLALLHTCLQIPMWRQFKFVC